MSNKPNPPNPQKPNPVVANKPSATSQPKHQTSNNKQDDSKSTDENKNIEERMKKTFSSNTMFSLKEYSIKDLVTQSKDFGFYLKDKKLETNQIRKFLDAINQLKSRLTQEDSDEIKKAKDEEEKDKLRFKRIEDDVEFLKVKLAWAAARQPAAKPFADVMSEAINKVGSTEDFYRLVQLIEAIIAYHKEAETKKRTGG